MTLKYFLEIIWRKCEAQIVVNLAIVKMGSLDLLVFVCTITKLLGKNNTAGKTFSDSYLH